jgi:hypothetical protein
MALPPANVDFGLGDVTGGIGGLKNILTGGGVSPTLPITLVNILAGAFGRESNNPKKAATFLLSQGNSLLTRQIGILNKAGLKDTPLYNELVSTKNTLRNIGNTGDFGKIIAFEPRLMSTLAKTQNVISPIPEGFTGNVFTGAGYSGGLDQRYARNIFSERTNHPINILRDYLDVLERKSGSAQVASGGSTLPKSGLAGLKTGSKNQKLLATEITTGKQTVKTVWPYPALDYGAIGQRYKGLGIEDGRGTTIPHTEYKFGEVDPNVYPYAPNIHTPLDGGAGGIPEPRVPQPGDPDFVGPVQPQEKGKLPNIPINQLLKLLPQKQFTPEEFEVPTLPNFDFFNNISARNTLSGGSSGFFLGRQNLPAQQPRQQQFSPGLPFSPTSGRLYSSRQKAPTGLAFLS